jgi:hypothetical protein
MFLDEIIPVKGFTDVLFLESIQKVERSGEHNTTRTSVMLRSPVV